MAITFELYEALKSIGIDEEKAKATAEKFEDTIENKFETELRSLATKEDLVRELSLVRQEMSRMEIRIIKWNVGTIIAVVSITVAIIKLIS